LPFEKPVLIYLGDLTYDTVTISTESFPLNIGYIASYCNSLFKNQIQIKLFKYIDKLEKEIDEQPPDILGMSNYVWCKRISLEMFRKARAINSQILTIWGGPNFPVEYKKQLEFMKIHEVVDIYVPGEGEVGFANIIDVALKSDTIKNIRKNVIEKGVNSCITRNPDGDFNYDLSATRFSDLDKIPSPYLNHLFDEFFDGKLTPMLQTNRGCPFSCTFCVDGSNDVNIVNRFSLERVKEEINYIALNSIKNRSLIITDLNFGMIPRDDEICDYLCDTQRLYNYPKQIQVTTGKNSKDRIIRTIKKLNDSIRFYMSVQSLDENVLTNIKRQNISADQMLKMRPAIQEAGLQTVSEVIMGLPGETYTTYIETLRKLVKAQISDIQVFQCMLLDGSELNTSEQIEKWNLKTKFRILPRDFVKLRNGKKILEIEEIVVSSDQMSFDEYLKARLIAFSMWVTNKGIIYDPILKFLREKNIDVFELFLRMSKNHKELSPEIHNIFELVKNATIDELWDSPNELEKFYQNDENFNKLLSGERGVNIMYYYHAFVIVTQLQNWTDAVLKVSESLLIEYGKLDKETQKQFLEISNYCIGLSYDPLGKNRNKTYYEYVFHYDIKKWLQSNENNQLNDFVFNTPQKISFQLTAEQIDYVNEKIDIFGETINGISQALKRIPLNKLWRFPTSNNF